MSKKSLLQRLEEAIVIPVPDERDRDVRDGAIQTGYTAGGLTALGVSAAREAFTGQSGLFWPTLAIVVLPLLIPLGRRLLAGGLAPADERARRIQTQAFRWASLLLVGGLAAFAMFRGVALGDTRATWNFLIPLHAGALFVFVTRIRHNTLPASARGWAVSAVLFLGTLIGLALVVLIAVALFGEPGSSTVVGMALMFGGIAVGYIAVNLWAAWRQRREEKHDSG